MADEERFLLRMRYAKLGRLRFLSHLEVTRALMRAVRRAGLPYAVSQGFSPHMKCAFGAALPVGCCGLDEYLDLQLTRYVEPAEALCALQAATPELLPVLACAYLPADEPALTAGYPVMEYAALVDASAFGTDEGRGIAGVRQAVEDLRAQGEVHVVKKGRPKSVPLEGKLLTGPDVAVPVPRETPDPDTLAPATAGTALLELAFMTRSDESGSLRPDALLAELESLAPVDLPVRWLAHVATYARAAACADAAGGLAGEGRPL